MKNYFLGIDLGTSSCKALVVDAAFKGIALASADCPVHQMRHRGQEQGLEKEVWGALLRAVRKVVAQINPADIAAISFSSAMHGFMPVDRNGKPLMLDELGGTGERTGKPAFLTKN